MPAGKVVASPLVGAFYVAPAEDAEAFVQIGDTVKKGQTLAIVEAMKLMNEIESDYDGTVAEVLVENGAAGRIRTAIIPHYLGKRVSQEEQMKHLDIAEIQEIIPHRHPFLLLDYIEDYEPGEYAVGYKCVTYREDFFAGHFPQDSRSCREYCTVEALAQAGAVAIFKCTGK